MRIFDHDLGNWVEEEIFEEEEECLETDFIYIINCGQKVGTWFDRYEYGFLDEQDEWELKDLASALAEPLRKGLFEDCKITKIFPMVKYE